MSEWNLFLPDDLENTSRASELAHRDLDALRDVADSITNFMARPHKDLGRDGPVCPFVPESLERKSLWLAPERIDGRGAPEVVDLVRSYQKILLNAEPTDGDGEVYKSVVVVFTDLPLDQAQDFFDEVLQLLAVPSYVDDGIVMGGFYDGNAGTAIYNSSFRPFASPVPYLLIRQTVTSDWKFFLDDEGWLTSWAQRHRGCAVHALANELRRLPWRAQPRITPANGRKARLNPSPPALGNRRAAGAR